MPDTDPMDQPEEGSVLFTTPEEEAEAYQAIWYNLHPGSGPPDYLFDHAGRFAAELRIEIHLSWSNGLSQAARGVRQSGGRRVAPPPEVAARAELLEQEAIACCGQVIEAAGGPDHGPDALVALLELLTDCLQRHAAYVSAGDELWDSLAPGSEGSGHE